MECHFDLYVFNLFSFFNLYLNVGRDDAQTKFGTVDLLCTILREVLNACVDHLRHTCFYTCFLFSKETKTKTSKGSSRLNNGEPKSYYYIFF